MIKFFRHIRQNLITKNLSDQRENKLARYLLYAVGEIVLVVIGILIAISINTWNKRQQDWLAQRELLVELRADLLIQQELIAEQIAYEALYVSQTDSARSFFSGAIDAVELHSLLRRLSARHTFVANKATVSKMTSTGQMTFIRNPQLVNSIVRYYQLSDYNTTVSNNNNLFIVDMQFGAFLSGNDLGFGSTESGELENRLTMDPQKRYLLQMQLSLREDLARSAGNRFNTLGMATATLLDLVNNELKRQ